MTVWIAVVAAGLLSFGLRMTPVALLTRFESPTWMDRASEFVAPAAFAALAAAALAATPAVPSELGPQVAAVAVTGAVAYARKSTGLAVLAGMATLLLAGFAV
jgi:branched-subunit amino acid transport protein